MPLMMGSRTIISVMISDGISAAALSPLSIAAGLYSTGIFTLEIDKDRRKRSYTQIEKKKKSI